MRIHSSNSRGLALLAALACLAASALATAQIQPTKESLSELYPGKAYSPYAQRRFPDR